MASMNEQILQTVRVELAKRNMSRTALADLVGLERQYLSDVLNGKSANMPKSWQNILEQLGITLIAVPLAKEAKVKELL